MGTFSKLFGKERMEMIRNAPMQAEIKRLQKEADKLEAKHGGDVVSGLDAATAQASIKPTDSYHELVGESNYQVALQIAGRGVDEDFEIVEQYCLVRLAPEPSNPHDKKAIVATVASLTVAYVAREDQKLFRSVMEKATQGGPVDVVGKIVGGGFRPDGSPRYFGIEVDLGDIAKS